MRTSFALVGLLALAVATPAHAVTFVFGSATNNSSCSLSGSGGDRSCTNTASVSNGSLDNFASVNVRGQASADHGITTNPTAIADITVSYSIPYTVTRDVTVYNIPGDGWFADFEEINLNFNLTYQGAAATSGATGGSLQNTTAYTASVSSAGGNFGAVGLTGASRVGGTGDNFFNDTAPDPSYFAGINFSGPARDEATTDSLGFPTDWRAWSDLIAPYQDDYDTDPAFTIQQTFTDTLIVSFRLRAESRPSGSISTTGGEAIACAGQTSPLGGFTVDDGLNCGSGLTVAVTASGAGAVTLEVPEPGTLALLGFGVAGLALFGRRRQS